MASGTPALADRIRVATTFLFVPADRPDRIPKALISGAGAVIIDLEDAAAPSGKNAARQSLRKQWDAYQQATPLIVRINSGDTADFGADLELLKSLQPTPGIMVAKAESAAEIQTIADDIDTPIIPLVESARGWCELGALAHAPGVVRMAVGAIDLALDVNSSHQMILDQVRVATVLHSRAAELAAPIDSPVPDISDFDRVREAATWARGLGMGAMLTIHPAQVDPAHTAFLPTEEQLNWARSVLAAAQQNPEIGAFRLGAEMVDAPVITRAKRLLELENTRVNHE